MAVKLSVQPKSTLQFTSRLNGVHIEQLCRMYQREWWSRGRKIEDVRRSLQHSDLIHHIAPDQHARTRDRLDRVDFVLITVGDEIAREPAALGKNFREAREIAHQIPRRGKAAAALQLHRPIAVEHFGSHDADLRVCVRECDELIQCVGLNERVGIERQSYEILGLKVPHITIPVRPGRDIARLIEVAAMDQKLKGLGQNSAVDFNTKLLNLMEPRST